MLDIERDVCPLLEKLKLPSNNKDSKGDLKPNITFIANRTNDAISTCLYQDGTLQREWFDEQIAFLRGLTSKERDLLRSYTRNGDEVVNIILRNPPNAVKELMKIVEKLKSPTTQLSITAIDAQGYRVMTEGLVETTKRTNLFDVELDTITEKNVVAVATRYAAAFKALMKRVPPVKTPFRVFRGVAPDDDDIMVYPLRGFSSTSYDPFTASIDIFTNSTSKCCVMEITLQKDVRALWIEPISHFEYEREILIDSVNVTTEIEKVPSQKYIARLTPAEEMVDRYGKPIPLGKDPIKITVFKCIAKPGGVFGSVMRSLGLRRGGMYWPDKYHRGLTRRQNAERKRSATRRTKMSFKNPRAYTRFATDKGVKTRRSSYTSRFHKKYPDAKTLPEIANATGVPVGTLRTVYDRGMAAWRTGHRPGASQQAWGMARVHSFVLKGKTYRTADKDLA
jgi:hypothetical protein